MLVTVKKERKKEGEKNYCTGRQQLLVTVKKERKKGGEKIIVQGGNNCW